MVNNKTQQKTNVNVGTVSETNIYLKKSELPKNVSSFKNDAGYISSSTLSTWLKEHSYISKGEINTLIKKANLVVVDSVNNIADIEAINRLNSVIADIKGEIVAIKDRLEDIESGFISISKESSFEKKSDITTVNKKLNTLTSDVSQLQSDSSTYATKEWVSEQGFLNSEQELKDYAKKSELSKYAKTSDLKDYAKKNTVYDRAYIDSKLLSKTDAESTYLNKVDAGEIYLSKTDAAKIYLTIEDYRGLKDATLISDEYKNKSLNALKNDINKLRNGFYIVGGKNIVIVKDHQIAEFFENGSFVTSVDYNDLINKPELKPVATTGSYNDLTDKPSIPSINGLASKSWVEGKGYLTEHQSLENYATKSEIPSTDGLASESFVIGKIDEVNEKLKWTTI